MSEPFGVLIVNGEARLRTLLAKGFRQRGCRVWLAEGAQEAVGLCRRHQDAIGLALIAADPDSPKILLALWKINPQLRYVFTSTSRSLPVLG